MALRTKGLEEYLQSEEAECGLMCVGAALAAVGRPVPVSDLRSWFPTSIRGMSVARMGDVVTSLGAVAVAVSCDISELPAVTLPAILHWRERHFVVLLARKKHEFTIFDPSKGLRRIVAAELAAAFSGTALTVEAVEPLSAKPPSVAIRWRILFGVGRELTGPLVGLLALSFFIQVLGLLVPLVSRSAINVAVSKGAMATLHMLLLCLIVVYLTTFAVDLYRSSINRRVSKHISVNTSRTLFRHALSLPLEWFERRRTVDVVSRFESVEPLRIAVAHGLPALLVDGLLALVLAGLMAFLSPLLTLVVVSFCVIGIALKSAFSPISTRLSAEASSQKIAEQGRRWESFRMISTLKNVGGEASQERLWHGLMRGYAEASDRLQAVAALQVGISQFINNACYVATLMAGAWLLLQGEASVGTIFAFIIYGRFLIDKMAGSIDQVTNILHLKYHLRRISEVLDVSPQAGWSDIRPRGQYVESGSLSLNSVSFRYSSQDPMLFSGLSMDLEGGQMAVILGPSGVGKTTLLKLILGNYKPTAGEIFIDGVLVPSFAPKQLRSAIACVMQDHELYPGSVLDNVVTFDDEPDLELAIRCLKQAMVWQQVKTLPMGVHTPVGEAGRALSAGQKQRIHFARALYGRPQVLLLDEATSHVDPETQDRIFEHLRQSGMTVVAVSHDPKVMRYCDRTFVIDDAGFRELGRVVAQV